VAQAPHQHIQRASRGLLAVARGDSQTHTHLRNRLLSIIWVTIAIGIISTFLVYLIERHVHHTQIHNLFDAFLFAMGQLLTASSVAAPTSTAGKVLEIFFDIYAITVVATLAGSFGSFFHRRSEERDKTQADAVAAATPDAEAPGDLPGPA
jgi:cytochrome c biogenesis protein CcdA